MTFEWLIPIAVLWWLHRTGIIGLDYRLRRMIRWRRGLPPLPSEPKAGLFSAEGEAEAARLISAFGLETWASEASRDDLATSLFYVQMLERAFRESGTTLPESVRALDAGPSDWFYVRGLHGFLARWGGASRAVSLDGVEADAWRVYGDFYSRYDWAQAYIGDLPGVRYVPEDVRRHSEPVDIAFMFFPFLFPADHVRWGLPRRALRPAEVLGHVASLVRPAGRLVIANQGEAERAEQHRLLREAGLEILWWAKHESPLWTYDPPKFITVAAVVREQA